MENLIKINKEWQRSGNCLFLRDIAEKQEKLNNCIYALEITPMGELYLKEISEKFKFDFKIYGLERPFIEKVLKAYKNSKGNLGVLCNGIKGTGKTVTTEILANELDLPIILVQNNFGSNTNTFISEIQQDLILFIDEYEKIYPYSYSSKDDEVEGDSTLLSLMDGIFKTKYRRVFLLTTNRRYVNENMINRPSRIRYIKEFKDLSIESIKEIIDDCLEDKKFKDEIIDFIKPLEIITVDIVKSIISEVNIFNESPFICCKDFNVEFKDDTYSVYKIEESISDNKKVKSKILVGQNIESRGVENFINRSKTSSYKNVSLYVGEECLSPIERFNSNNNSVLVVEEEYRFSDSDIQRENAFTIILEKEKFVHDSFML